VERVVEAFGVDLQDGVVLRAGGGDERLDVVGPGVFVGRDHGGIGGELAGRRLDEDLLYAGVDIFSRGGGEVVCGVLVVDIA
jgi:hypothetical protein